MCLSVCRCFCNTLEDRLVVWNTITSTMKGFIDLFNLDHLELEFNIILKKVGKKDKIEKNFWVEESR